MLHTTPITHLGQYESGEKIRESLQRKVKKGQKQNFGWFLLVYGLASRFATIWLHLKQNVLSEQRLGKQKLLLCFNRHAYISHVRFHVCIVLEVDMHTWRGTYEPSDIKRRERK